MSILIKGMKMPIERQSFTITIQYNGLVIDSETGIPIGEARELPPHGRLIDGDKLAAQCDDPHWCVWLSEILDAPTIIESEGTENDSD